MTTDDLPGSNFGNLYPHGKRIFPSQLFVLKTQLRHGKWLHKIDRFTRKIRQWQELHFCHRFSRKKSILKKLNTLFCKMKIKLVNEYQKEFVEFSFWICFWILLLFLLD